MAVTNVDLILCADWGKSTAKRAIYAADVAARTVTRIERDAWTFRGAVEYAREKAGADRRVLLGFDVPFGVPRSYCQVSVRAWGRPQPQSFIQWLQMAREQPRLFEAQGSADQWSPARPFFAVPSGKGSLTRFREAAARADVQSLTRTLDDRLRAKSVFITSGIPGSVGSSVLDIWPLISDTDPAVRYWPFHGRLDSLLAPGRVVVGEIYPRAAYAIALTDGAAIERPALDVDKTIKACRSEAVRLLGEMIWIQQYCVRLDDREAAVASEDNFDAMISAAALLRCVLEKTPLEGTEIDPIEGGILCTGSINPDLPAKRFTVHRAGAHKHATRESSATTMRHRRRVRDVSAVRSRIACTSSLTVGAAGMHMQAVLVAIRSGVSTYRARRSGSNCFAVSSARGSTRSCSRATRPSSAGQVFHSSCSKKQAISAEDDASVGIKLQARSTAGRSDARKRRPHAP